MLFWLQFKNQHCYTLTLTYSLYSKSSSDQSSVHLSLALTSSIINGKKSAVCHGQLYRDLLFSSNNIPSEYWMETPFNAIPSDIVLQFLPSDLLAILPQLSCRVLQFPNPHCPFVSPFFGLKYNQHEKNLIPMELRSTEKVSCIICSPQ